MAQTVIQHVLSRLHDLGVRDVFGDLRIPGCYPPNRSPTDARTRPGRARR